MSDFTLLSTDASLWEMTMKSSWRSHDLSGGDKFPGASDPQAQLDTLSQAMAWRDAEKPQWDMAFLLITPSTAAGYERIFGLLTIWSHPCQDCYITLVDVVHKLVLLVDSSADWVSCHTPLSSMATSVPWQKVSPPQTPTADFNNSKCINCYRVRTWWCVQKVSMARWKPHSLPSKSFPPGMPLLLANLPVKHSW